MSDAPTSMRCQVWDTVIEQPISPVLERGEDASPYVNNAPHGPQATEVRDVVDTEDGQ